MVLQVVLQRSRFAYCALTCSVLVIHDPFKYWLTWWLSSPVSPSFPLQEKAILMLNDSTACWQLISRQFKVSIKSDLGKPELAFRKDGNVPVEGMSLTYTDLGWEPDSCPPRWSAGLVALFPRWHPTTPAARWLLACLWTHQCIPAQTLQRWTSLKPSFLHRIMVSILRTPPKSPFAQHVRLRPCTNGIGTMRISMDLFNCCWTI